MSQYNEDVHKHLYVYTVALSAASRHHATEPVTIKRPEEVAGMMRIIRTLGGFALIFVCGMFGAWLYGADIAVKLGGSDGIAALALLAILAVMIYIGLLTLANANFGETDFGFKHGLVAGGTTLVLAIGLFGLWRFAESISRIDPAIWWLLLASAITTGLVWFIFRYRASTA